MPTKSAANLKQFRVPKNLSILFTRGPATPTLRDKGTDFQDSRSVGSVMHPCAQRLWMPVPCSQTKPPKICSVNFRPFSAYKELSEFETVPCPKNLSILFTRGTAARSHRGKSRATSVDAKLARTHFFDVLLKSCDFFWRFCCVCHCQSLFLHNNNA